MKKIYSFIAILIISVFFLAGSAEAQVTVNVTNPTNTTPNLLASYSSFAAALTDLNLVTAMTGPVTLTLQAGSETAPIKGFVLGSATLNPVLSATNTITITNSGTVTINAGVGTSAGPSATPDGMLILNGADYVTINGLTFTDGNSTSATVAMEFGIALFKRSAGDGCNYNIIQNCTFNMQRINNGSGSGPLVDGSVAIGVYNSIYTAATTVLTPTNGGTLATNGTNSNNKFYTNAINSGNYGIALNGYAATVGVGPTPTATTFLGDLNNDIGGASSGQGNTILNFGGGAATNPSAGIRANNQWSINISYNTINNNNGGGVNHATTLRGIYAQAGTSGNVTITYNTVTVKGGGTTSQVSAIENAIGSTAASNTVNINYNTIENCTYTTGTTGIFYNIYNTATAATVNINNNIIRNSTYTGAITTGNFYCITNSATAVVVINNNSISNLTIGGTATAMYCISVGSPTGAGCSANSNTITNITRTGASGTHRGIIMTSPTNNMTFNSNTIDGIYWTTVTSTGSIDGIYGLSSATNITVSNNIIRNLSTPTTGTINGIREWGSTGTKIFQNNQIYNFSTYSGGTGGATFNGIFCTTGNLTISGNQVYALNSAGSTGGTGGTINGIMIAGGTTHSIYKNNIYNLSSTSTNPVVAGITNSAGTTNNIYNNYISDIKATASTGANSVIGLNISGGTTVNAFYNTIYLNAIGGATFGSSGIYKSATVTSEFRNNIIVNNSTPGATSGNTVALRWSGAYNATYYTATSNNNCFFAGTPGINRLIYFDGTNSDQTIDAYKTRVASRDAASFSENPPFVNVATTPYDLHLQTTVPTQCESGGSPVSSPSITDDFDGNIRNVTTPDVGADEGGFTGLDMTAPTISYTPLGNTGGTGNRNLSATITDYSGVPTSGIGLPVLYWKINAGAYTAATATFISGNNYQFTFGAGVTAGDVVSYYVVAQDMAGTPNVGANPSGGAGGFSANPPAATTPPTTPSSYTITAAPLSGDYTVGVLMFNKVTGKNITFEKVTKKVMKEVEVEAPVTEVLNNTKVKSKGDNSVDLVNGSDQTTAPSVKTIKVLKEVEEISYVPMENGKVYEGNLYIKKSENPNYNYPMGVNGIYGTITAAVADLNLRGVSGHTRFLLTDATYTTPNETFPITVNVANENVPTSSATVTIKPNTGVTALIQGASPSAQIFNIRNNYVTIDGSNAVSGTSRDLTIENTSTTSPQVIGIRSNGVTPITNVTVKNSILINGSNGSTALVVSDLAGTAGYFNNITVQNNSVQKAYIGVYFLGTVSAGNGSGTLITGNDMNTSGANSIRLIGVYVQGVDGATVSNNNIGNIANANAESPRAIVFATGTNSGTISGNNINGIAFTGAGAYAPTGIACSPGATATSISITNNTINNITNSVGTNLSFCGISSFSPNTNVTNNTVSNLTQSAAYAFWGIVQSGAVNSSCSNNTVYAITTTNTGVANGINIQGVSTGVTISKNKIYNIKNTNSGGYTAVALALSSSSTTANITASNNIIYDVAGYGWSSLTTDNGYGINIYSGGGYNLYYNSVNMATNQTLATSNPACLIINSAVTTANTLDIRNNIFSHPATVGTNRYAVLSNAANTVFSNINYNNYFTSGSNIGYIGATDRTNLAAWQTGTGKDANSVSGDPKYLSATDLHIDPNVSSPVNNAGTPIAGITTDYDGDTRSGSTPDIGMDEYTYIAPAVEDPTVFTATNIHSTQLDLSWTNNGNNNDVMIVWNSSNTFATPVDGNTYTVGGNVEGVGTVLYIGPDQFTNHTGLSYSTTYYYKAYSVDVSNMYSPGSAITKATTLPAVPVTFTSTSASGTQINLSWTKNAASNDVIVASNSSSTFGNPVNGTTYNTSDPITGGGTVIYRGPASGYNHTGLTPATTYYYKAWSVDAGVGYSTTGLTTNNSTAYSIPYTQNFNAGLTIPAGWSTNFAISATHGAASTNGLFKNLWSSAPTGYATTPFVGVVTANTRLYFDYRIVDYTGYPATGTTYGAGNSILVQVSTDGTNFSTVYTIDNTTHVTSNAFASKTIDISSYNGSTIFVKFNCTWASGDYYIDFDNVEIKDQVAMAYASSTTTQNTNQLPVNSTNQQIIGIQVVTSGNQSPLSITDFELNTTGTTAPATDITNAKIFYTGTTGTFSATGQFGSTVASPNGTFNISGTQTLAEGTNYFWLTYDIPSGATGGNNVDAECTQITIGSNYTPTITAPAGVRQIIGPLAGGTYTVGISAFNKATGRNLYEQTVTRKIETENNKKSIKQEEKVTIKQDNSSSKDSEFSGKNDRNTISEMTMTSMNSNLTFEKGNNPTEETVTLLYENGKPYDGPLYFYPEKKTVSTQKVDSKTGSMKPKEIEPDAPNAVYATITAAITDLNTRGISGAVVFSLIDATYGSETLPITINNVTGGSATNTVTIKPASGVSPSISSASINGAIFKLNGADYVTIDGSNNGTTSKDMTISNTNTGATTCAIWIGSASASDGASYNTIKNCNFIGSSSSTTIAGIVIGSGITFGSAGEIANNNNTVQNNTFTAFQNGIYHNGIATFDQNLVISGNTFGSSVVASKLGFRGMILQNVQNFSVTGNTILGIVSTASSSSTMTGIQIGGNVDGGTISKNSISDIKQINTAGWGSNGIYLSAASTASNLTISNNVIFDVASYGYSGSSQADNGYGIMVNAGGGYKIYNNSINLATNQTSTTGIPACINVASAITTAGSLDIRNNVFANNQTLGTYCYAIYSGAASNVYLNLDFNNYYAPNANGRMGYIGAVTYSTLTAWVSANPTLDKYSVSGNPGFTTSTNLTPDATNANSWVLSGNGTHIATVTDDYTGAARPADVTAGAPDIGAYEFGVPSVEPNNFNISVVAGLNNLTVNGRVFAALQFTTIGTATSVDVKFYTGKNPPGTSGYPTAQFMNAYYTISPNVGASGFTYNVIYNYSEPQRGTIVNEADIRLAKSDNNGTNWVSYTSQGTGPNMYELNNTTNQITVYGLTAFSTFTNSDVNAPLPVQLSSFNASLKGRDVTLAWKTESEINNAGFDVERKDVNSNEWKKAGYVTGKGTTNSPVNYTFEDKKLNSGKYNYRLKQIDNNGNFTYHTLSTVVDVALPTKFNLSQNYPNPFNPTTKIDFDLPFDSKVNIILYDMTGREVKTLVNDARTAGYYTLQFNASDLSSGTYFYRIMTKSNGGDYMMTKKMMLVK